MHGRVIQTLYIPHLPCYEALSGVWLFFFFFLFSISYFICTCLVTPSVSHMHVPFFSTSSFDGSARVKRDTTTEGDSSGRPVYLISQACMHVVIVSFFILSGFMFLVSPFSFIPVCICYFTLCLEPCTHRLTEYNTFLPIQFNSVFTDE
ncbi:hypothetical protein BO78DRAFT_218076 [Aspergillus sclerotiicarbonarius CBS 121057]|uniref:Uncharacterized protein n=1 Tax=Aspergillus sclerotiicarbonarius (strain CBS 121057 / IBT 28362) TaxID=1448318 RepID=A0A319F421_ASPSB|nr:hypothetical protein BO78DRAFT_218076 [Aspergillus sclerotiicarbonarius CBS 121057]